MGRTVGLWPSTVGHMGPVRDVLVCPGTLGREGQWDCGPPLWDTWDLSGMSQGSRDSGTGRTVGLWPSTVGHMGPIPGCPRGPGTLGWEGQCVWDCIQHRTPGTFLNLSCKIGPVGFLGIVTANLDKCGHVCTCLYTCVI